MEISRDRPPPQTTALVQEVLALSTADKFRLAAELVDLGDLELAEAVGRRAWQEIARPANGLAG